MKNTNQVIYNNDMNLIPLRGFSSNEMNLLFSICIKMRDEGILEVTSTFDEIKALCNYKRNSTSVEFGEELRNIYQKMLLITCSYTENLRFKGFVLFSDYDIDISQQTAKIRINSNFAYILNDLTKNFTQFEMIEFSSLESSYSKTAYKLLKQYHSTGYAIFTIDDFKNRFCIPKSYQMCNIDNRVFNPIKKELESYFKDLKINKIKAKKGRKITHIEFVFSPESKVKNKVEKTILLEEKNENLVLKEKINAVKNAIPTLEEDDIKILVETADIPIILEKYYTLAIGKEIDNLTGFLMAAIKNNWKKAPSKTVEKKAVDGEMDELERRLQKRLFEKLNPKNSIWIKQLYKKYVFYLSQSNVFLLGFSEILFNFNI